MWSEQSHKLKETLWQATSQASCAWDAKKLSDSFISCLWSILYWINDERCVFYSPCRALCDWVHRLESSEILWLIHVGFLLMWWRYIMGRARSDSVFQGSSKTSKKSKYSGSVRWQTLWIIVILAFKLYYF